MSLDHLRLGGPVRIDAIESVKDEISLIARRAEAGDNRVEHTEIFGRNKDQSVRSFRSPDPRRREGDEARACGPEQVASTHVGFLPMSAPRRFQLRTTD